MCKYSLFDMCKLSVAEWESGHPAYYFWCESGIVIRPVEMCGIRVRESGMSSCQHVAVSGVQSVVMGEWRQLSWENVWEVSARFSPIGSTLQLIV